MTDYQELAEAIKGDVAAVLNGTPFSRVHDEIFRAISFWIAVAEKRDSTDTNASLVDTVLNYTGIISPEAHIKPHE